MPEQRAYWQWTEIGGVMAASAMEPQPDYAKWSTEDLIKRVAALERQLKDQTAK